MKKILIIILVLTSCSTAKETVSSINEHIPKPTHLQPDTCLTDKQFKMYLKFVKDSMKIENQRTKIEYKYIRDTVRIVERSNRVDLRRSNKTERTNILQNAKTVRDTTKQAKKTNRTQIRQEEKTKRTKWYVWFIFGFGSAIILNLAVKVGKNQIWK